MHNLFRAYLFRLLFAYIFCIYNSIDNFRFSSTICFYLFFSFAFPLLIFSDDMRYFLLNYSNMSTMERIYLFSGIWNKTRDGFRMRERVQEL